MRSDRVFDALHTLRNRYMLCQLASKATRKFHRPSTRIQETMNVVLDRIAGAERQAILSEPENVAEAQRRTAQAGPHLQDPAGAERKRRPHFRRRRAGNPPRWLRVSPFAGLQLPAGSGRHLCVAVANPQV